MLVGQRQNVCLNEMFLCVEAKWAPRVGLTDWFRPYGLVSVHRPDFFRFVGYLTCGLPTRWMMLLV